MPVTLTKAPYGFTVVMSGLVTAADLEGHLVEARNVLPSAGSFGLLVDQRDCKVLDATAQAKHTECIQYFMSQGLVRVADVLASAVLTMQVSRLVAASPAAPYFLAVDGKNPRWQQISLDWIVKGVRES